MEDGKEAGGKIKLRVIKGGQSPNEIVEVSSIGDYKPFHPSRRREGNKPNLKLIKGGLSEEGAEELKSLKSQGPVAWEKGLMARVLDQLDIDPKKKSDSKKSSQGKTS